jgi:glycine cleavage system H lipoate-binding protein
MEQDGAAKIGIDDFAKKLIGKIDSIEFPNLGMVVKKGQPLFTIKQGVRSVTFNSPVSGKVTRINTILKSDLEVLDITSYNSNWICIIDADDLDSELKDLTIGKTAVSFYENDLDRFIELRNKSVIPKDDVPRLENELYIGEFEKMDDSDWDKMVAEFFKR